MKRDFKVTIIDEKGNVLKLEAKDCVVQRTLSNRVGLDGNIVIETIQCKTWKRNEFKVTKK